MTDQVWLRTSAGTGLLIVPPPEAQCPPAPSGRRLAGLLRASGAGQGAAPVSEPWGDLTLAAPAFLNPDALLDLIGELQRLDPAPVIRIEADWTAASWDAEPLLRAARMSGEKDEAPFFVHGLTADPAALNSDTERGIAALADAGIPLSAEVWLIRGLNDSVETLRGLMKTLLGLRVRPSYLVDGEWLEEGERVPEGEAERLVRGLRGWISGTGVPQYVRESSGGVRRLLVPDYVREMREDAVRVTDFRGVERVYRNPPRTR